MGHQIGSELQQATARGVRRERGELDHFMFLSTREPRERSSSNHRPPPPPLFRHQYFLRAFPSPSAPSILGAAIFFLELGSIHLFSRPSDAAPKRLSNFQRAISSLISDGDRTRSMERDRARRRICSLGRNSDPGRRCPTIATSASRRPLMM